MKNKKLITSCIAAVALALGYWSKNQRRHSSVEKVSVISRCRFEKNPSREELDALAKEVLTILKKEDEEAKRQGKQDAALMKVKNDKKVMIIGDMHGHLEALLCIPIAEKILQEGGLVITLGDMIDQHMPLGPELSLRCLYEVLNLKKKYPKSVIVLRGNHESYFHHPNMGYSINEDHCDEIVRTCVSHLPLACTFENGGKKFFCVHGGICEEMYKKHSEDDNFGLTKFQEFSRKFDRTAIVVQVLWNDFKGPGRGVRKNAAPFVKNFLEATGYQAIFRGHSPSHTAQDSKDNGIEGEVYTILSNSPIFKRGMKKNDERNARYAIIEEGDVIVEYFTNSFIEGEFIGEVE